MSKRTTGYYLDESNIKWLEKMGNKDGRSASNYLDRLISSLRKEANEKD